MFSCSIKLFLNFTFNILKEYFNFYKNIYSKPVFFNLLSIYQKFLLFFKEQLIVFLKKIENNRLSESINFNTLLMKKYYYFLIKIYFIFFKIYFNI